ncbi:hypothetical protein CSKR_106950 [Clonorchis sinensis]|uniref:Uncharacterized protein n=1 Tax=Clonorchis sinensis TaxID=79923 RepID=A0A3R7EYN4_CLOSI|nr:hypothetical protein CSKR_106950 [Clonorchis sinensis]
MMITDRNVRGSNPAAAFLRSLTRLRTPGSVSAFMFPPDGMEARHRMCVTTEQKPINPTSASVLIGAHQVARMCLLVVDQMAVDLFAELGNWLANVSFPVEETSKHLLNCALTMSPRLGTKCLQANCQARRTDQLPSDQPPGPTYLDSSEPTTSELHSFANKFGFARDSPETQLNLSFVTFPAIERAAPGRLMFQLVR